MIDIDNSINKIIGNNKKNKKNNMSFNNMLDTNKKNNMSFDNMLGTNKNNKIDMQFGNMFKNKNMSLFNSMTFGNISKQNNNNMGASIQMQNKWKNMNSKQRIVARQNLKDTDGDRIPNMFDCQPKNTMRQDSEQEYSYIKFIIPTNTSSEHVTYANQTIDGDEYNATKLYLDDENDDKKVYPNTIIYYVDEGEYDTVIGMGKNESVVMQKVKEYIKKLGYEI